MNAGTHPAERGAGRNEHDKPGRVLPVPVIDIERCTGCGLCVRVCPNQALEVIAGCAVVIDPSACTYTGHCERICPTQAISRQFQIVRLPKEKKLMQTIFVADWRDQAIFSPDGPHPQVLVQTDKLKVIIGSLEAGQVIPLHPEALAVYHFLDGSGWMTVDDQRYPVLSGTIIITPEGAARGVEAETRLVFLAARIA